jgi:hypothetical protein
MSTLKADTIQSTGGGAATLTKQSAAKGWVNFDGSAGTISARGSLNVSGFTDHASGEYTITLSNAFDSTNNMAPVGSNGNSVTDPANSFTSCVAVNTTSTRHEIYSGSNTKGDRNFVYVIQHGDLA